MAQYRKHSLASAIALAVGLSACGGGGGGGLVSTPTPTPTPTPGTIGAAAQATLPNGSTFPQASSGGPTIDDHSETMFPLIETVVRINSNGAAADTSAMSGVAGLRFEATGNVDDEYSLTVPGLGTVDLSATSGGFYDCYGLCGESGSKSIVLYMSDAAATGLDWTTFGTWDAFDGASARSMGAFVTGYRTPAGSVPTTGTATYTGSTEGRVMYPNVGSLGGVGVGYLSGNATLEANFGGGSITGSLTNMSGPGGAWNSVSLAGAISGGNFTGTSAASSSPGTLGSLSGSASGTLAGTFFGPGAEELGAVWTLHDGVNSAIGTIGASRGP